MYLKYTVVSEANKTPKAGPTEKKLSEDKENTTKPFSCRKSRPPSKYRHFLIRSIKQHKHAQKRPSLRLAQTNDYAGLHYWDRIKTFNLFPLEGKVETLIKQLIAIRYITFMRVA